MDFKFYQENNESGSMNKGSFEQNVWKPPLMVQESDL